MRPSELVAEQSCRFLPVVQQSHQAGFAGIEEWTRHTKPGTIPPWCGLVWVGIPFSALMPKKGCRSEALIVVTAHGSMCGSSAGTCGALRRGITSYQSTISSVLKSQEESILGLAKVSRSSYTRRRWSFLVGGSSRSSRSRRSNRLTIKDSVVSDLPKLRNWTKHRAVLGKRF